jgi:HK97 family phage portal protein
MAILDWFRKPLPALQQKASQAGRSLFLQTMGSPVWTPRRYDALAVESYMKNAIAYRCVRMIAEASASIPFLIYSGEDEVEDHELIKLLRRPNPFQSGDEMWDAFYSFYRIAGNTYLEAVMLDGKPKELFVLRPDRMRIKVGPTGYPESYLYRVGGQREVEFVIEVGKQMPVLHMREFHPLSDWYGMAPVEAGAFSVDVHNAAGAYNKSLLDNQARPSGALVYSPPNENADSSLTDKQYDRLKKELEDRYSGPQNAGKPMLLEGGLDWKEMATNPKDMEFIEGKREAAREVALTYGVPPQLLGIPGDNTFSNYQEANRAFYRQTIIPLVTKACRALTNFFMPSYGEEIRIGFDEDKIPALDTEREALWKRINESRFLTINEKREAVGYEPYEPKEPGEDGTGGEKVGDVILVSSGDTPLMTTDLVPGSAATGVDEDGEPIEPEDAASQTQDADAEPASSEVGAKPLKRKPRTPPPPSR